MILQEVLPAALHNERLDRIVALIADISRSDASALVEAGGASVDGIVAVSGKVRLREGQSVEVDTGKIPVPELPTADASVVVTVVWQDDDMVVINKQAGLVVHPAAGHRGGTLVNGLLALYPEMSQVGEAMRPGIVHRLDVGTTGLMVAARTQRAYDALVAALGDHDVTREYEALVWGHLESPSTVVDAPIGRDPRDPLKMAVARDGKWARTHVTQVETFDEPADLARVKCSLETGRTHQIRVHLAAIGHPVVGDATYGGARSALRASRPMLHAARLSFVHPFTDEVVEFVAPLPEDMAALLAQMGHSHHHD